MSDEIDRAEAEFNAMVSASPPVNSLTALRLVRERLESRYDRAQLCFRILRDPRHRYESGAALALEDVVMSSRIAALSPNGFSVEEEDRVLEEMKQLCRERALDNAEPIIIRLRAILGDKHVLAECQGFLQSPCSRGLLHGYALQSLANVATTEASEMAAAHMTKTNSEKCKFFAANMAAWNNNLLPTTREKMEHYLLARLNTHGTNRRAETLFALSLIGNAAARAELAEYSNALSEGHEYGVLRSLVIQRFGQAVQDAWKQTLSQWLSSSDAW